jgi:HD-GYP domain-containing protein (c-di-GMP phosphodiesterase class II)
MRKVNKELWLLLSLVVIAAILNFMVSSHLVVLSFFFLPTLFSAYSFGRRHATLTACFSVFLVVLLTYLNPTLLSHHMAAPGESGWSDLTVWGGILVVTAYAMGTLHERNQKSLNELKDSYGGMLVIVQQFLTNEKYSQAHCYRVSLYATKIAESLGLDAGSIEDVRTAALLRNVNELGISNEILYKAANISQEELQSGMPGRRKPVTKAQATGGSLRRVIPILVAEQTLTKSGGSLVDAALEVQVLALADAYESLISETGPRKLSPAQAEEILVKSSGKKYDSMVVDAFVKAFGQQAQGAGA